MQFYICEKLNCAHEEMTVLDITLTEIGPGDLRLEEDVPLLGQAQTALLVVGVVAVPPCLDAGKDARPLQAPYMLAEDGTLGILVLHVEGVAAPCILRLGSNRVKQRAGRRAGEAVAVFPHEVDHIRSHAAQHLLVVLCKTTGGKCGS